jgi:hypothetical protein
MRAAIAVASILVALCTRAAAQGQVLPLSGDDQQRITKLLVHLDSSTGKVLGGSS